MEMPEAFRAEEPRREGPAWFADLAIALGLGLVVLGAWLIQERWSEPDLPAEPVALPLTEATKLIDGYLLVVQGSLPAPYKETHTADAVLIDRATGQALHGVEGYDAAEMASSVAFLNDPVRTTDVEMASDNVAVFGTSWGLGTESERRGAGIVIVTFEGDKISREVVIPMGGVRATDDLLP